MKKIVTVLSVILLITSWSISAFAETSDLVHDYVDVTVMGFDDDSAVIITGVDSLKEDPTVITEEDFHYIEKYNEEHEKKMSCSLELKVLRLDPEMYVNAVVPEDKNDGTIQGDPFSHDPSVSELCTDQNFTAYKQIPQSTDSEWYVVSIVKYGRHAYEGPEAVMVYELFEAGCHSQSTYDITFPIPSKYCGSADLRMAKIDKGQVSYMEDIDFDENTFTIRTNGSAVYVFVGTANDDINGGSGDVSANPEPKPLELVKVEKPEDDTQNTNPADNTGTVTAPKTADAANTTGLILAVISAGMIVMLCGKKKCEV